MNIPFVKKTDSTSNSGSQSCKTKVTDSQKSTFKSALSMPKVLNPEYEKAYNGEKHNEFFKFKCENDSVNYLAKAENGSIYEVNYYTNNPKLRRAKIVNEDGSIMNIDSKDENSGTRYFVDVDNDGECDYNYLVKFNEKMDILSAEEDEDNNGIAEKQYRYVYDDNDGHLAKTYVFSRDNETGNREYDLELEALGLNSSYQKNQKVTANYYDKNGKADYTTTSIYDELGRIREYIYDDHHENLLDNILGTSDDYTVMYSYDTDVAVTYNAKGKVINVEYKD